ncbi:hypothetical protein CsSME_00040352 [Camellia sinensis var. sinensis]
MAVIIECGRKKRCGWRMLSVVLGLRPIRGGLCHFSILVELRVFSAIVKGSQYLSGYFVKHFTLDFIVLQLEFPAQFPCLFHIAMCSALCNESVLQYNSDKGNYEKIGESTEVALRVLAEKVGLPGFDSYLLL